MTNMLKTINPASGNKLNTYKIMTDDAVLSIVENCHTAFLDWRHQSLEYRGDIIKKIGQALLNRKHELARVMTDEMGKLLQQSLEEVELCAAICDYTVASAPEHLASEKRDLGDGQYGLICYEPIGIIFGIQPWNYPAYQVIRYSIANLMAGNGVLLKHAESVTGTGLLLEEIYQSAGLPAALFSVLLVDHDQSETVIKHRRVRGVTLTGSPAAGRIVGQQAAAELKKTVLELGSNDAYLVLEDADLEKAVKICVQGRIYNNGETCIAAKRFIVVDAIYDQFRDAFVKAMQQVKMGDPMSDTVDLGPMARQDLRDDLHQQVEESVAKGAKILCGGNIPDCAGFYYPATVLAEVSPGQPAYDAELFGPVASLIRAADATDAMRIANDSPFGLGGGIITEDTEQAIELATKYFDTGMVFINGFGLANPKMPFGGVKDSGYGREHGGFGMREFVNTKSVLVMG
ncbi:succinate-semialdehyde dehydrogenase [Arsukibacterium sp. MJ3]|uniref:NAD-dependent succinate-semialdehyde dehydrogenase n=1 Tax=Arsukibacterium sp. MJ3 TaxID=1632859 RepID=UPI00062714B3|nr:NAD-dependent succinate-semialdehyde dehydrogenase [Arsukibacterium sp. MJ3]KKO49869.1 succinate-semialdehyde dehydrogenase [Arsukibacterium sp. MJ3]